MPSWWSPSPQRHASQKKKHAYIILKLRVFWIHLDLVWNYKSDEVFGEHKGNYDVPNNRFGQLHIRSKYRSRFLSGWWCLVCNVSNVPNSFPTKTSTTQKYRRKIPIKSCICNKLMSMAMMWRKSVRDQRLLSFVLGGDAVGCHNGNLWLHRRRRAGAGATRFSCALE